LPEIHDDDGLANADQAIRSEVLRQCRRIEVWAMGVAPTPASEVFHAHGGADGPTPT
jgi:hypothetical protein